MLRRLSLTVAAREATEGVSAHVYWFCLPMVAAELVALSLTAIPFHSTKGPAGALAGLALLVVCLTMTMTLQAGVADAYLRWKLRAEAPDIRFVAGVVRYPGFPAMMFRLLGRFFLWILPAVAVGALIFAGFGMGHHLAGAGKSGLRTLIWMALLDAAWSRYGFVIPLFTLYRWGSKELFADAVRLAQPYWGVLALLAVMETIIVLGPNILVRSVFARHPVGGALESVWRLLNVIFAGVFAGWYVIFRVSLLRQARLFGTREES